MFNIKQNYQVQLDNLVGIFDANKNWVNVKMIDFAHTFSTDECGVETSTNVDSNYLNGIENLVLIFEEFLKKCD